MIYAAPALCAGHTVVLCGTAKPRGGVCPAPSEPYPQARHWQNLVVKENPSPNPLFWKQKWLKEGGAFSKIKPLHPRFGKHHLICGDCDSPAGDSAVTHTSPDSQPNQIPTQTSKATGVSSPPNPAERCLIFLLLLLYIFISVYKSGW